MAFFQDVFKVVGDVVENAVVGKCYLENDTKYKVLIVDHDGTRTLYPGKTEFNYLVKGFSVDLVMKFTDTKEEKINFPSSMYENRTHKMSMFFADKIKAYELSLVKVVSAVCKWSLIHNHPGGYDEEREVQMVSKHSWKTMQERGGEIEGKVGSMIKGVELGLSAKASMKLTRVDEFETQTTEKIKRKFTRDPCYLWQEIVVVKTNKEPPFHELQIPTPHIEHTPNTNEPGKDKFIYD